MRAFWRNSSAVLLAATMVSSAIFAADPADSQDLIRRYKRETSELAKRDLTLKMIDTAVLKLHEATRKDIERIFGSDWQMFADDPEDVRPYGIVHFAKQPSGPDTEQVPYVGWYLVVYYSPKSYVVVDWHISNVHK
jgi:hypothetical protein